MGVATEKASLKKELKLRQLFSLAFGTIIGVGWVTVLGKWLTQAGSLGAVIAFLAGGLVMIFIGLTYSEMAAMFPVSGGEVAYAYEAYGLKTSFMTGWLLSLTYIGVVVFEVISVGWVAGSLFPALEGHVLYSFLGDNVFLGSVLVGILGTLVLTFVNYRGAGMAATFQDLLVLGLLIVSAIFMAVGMMQGDTENLRPLFLEGTSTSWWGGVLAVFATAPFWYSGFDTIPQAMGEKAEGAPLHLVSRVVVLAIVVAAVFYAGVIIATSMVLPRSELTALDLPTAGAFTAAFGSPFWGRVVLFAGLLGLLSSWNAFFFAGSRVLYALGRSRVLPAFFGYVHPKYQTPTGAILFVTLLSLIGAFLGRSAILPIVNTGGLCLAAVFVLTCVGVFRLRKSQPDRPRPYRASSLLITLGALGSFVMLVLSFLQPYWDESQRWPLEWTFLLVWGALGVLFWFMAAHIRNGISENERRVLMLDPE